MSLPLYVEPSPQICTSSSSMARTRSVPVTARPRGVVVVSARPPADREEDRPAGSRGAPLLDQRRLAVHEAGALRAVGAGPARHGLDVGLVVLPQVGGVGVVDRPLLAHPRDSNRGVKAAGEGDPDTFTDRQGG